MKFFIVLFWLFSGFGFCQSNTIYKDIIKELNVYNTSKAKILIGSLGYDEKRFFLAEIDYIEKGKLESDFVFSLANTKNPFLKSLFYNALGDLQLRTSKKFTHKAHLNYLKSFEIANTQNDIFLKEEVLRRILINYQMNNMNSGDYEKYAATYLKISSDDINIFWAKYYDFYLKAYKKYKNEKINFSSKSYDSLLPLVQEHPILLGKVYQMKDVCSAIDKQVDTKEAIQLSKNYFSKSKHFIARKALLGIILNEAVNDIEENNFPVGIKKLRNCLSNKSINPDEQLQLLVIGSLYDAYSKINKVDSALYFLNQKNNLEAQIKNNENYIITHEIDARFQLKEKNRQIFTLTALNINYQKNKIYYFITIFIILLLVVYFVNKWKKSEINKRKLAAENQYLETQHFKTVEELKTVKKLIEKESIILKDKTKVNLELLAFIKADDHYLSIHTIEKRKHFVRGKLSEIIEELPSNFIKCHRSYIINKNHIKQIQSKFIIMNDNSEIPVSRGFRM